MLTDINSRRRIAFFNKLFSHRANKNLLAMPLSSKEEFATFLRVSGIKKGMNVVDFGCGDGRFTLPLLYMGCKVTGVDPAKEALKSLVQSAKEHNLLRNLHVSTNDFTKPEPQLKSQFDAGFLVSTYHILSNDEHEKQEIFKNFLETIKPEGKVLLLEPNPLNPLFYPYYIFIHSIPGWNKRQIFYNNRWHLTKVMKAMRLDKIKVIPYGFFPESIVNNSHAGNYIVRFINKAVNRIPIINLISAFNFYVAEK